MEFFATLPLPPSANNLFATVGRRRVVARPYADWRQLAGLAYAWPRVSEDRANRIPWTIAITAHGLGRRRDIDNLAKPLIDLIVAHTGLRDNWLEAVTVARSPVDHPDPGVFLHVRYDPPAASP